MKNEDYKNSSFLSSIMKAVGLRSRREGGPSGKDLFGMGGTFGRARIKHCSSWEFGSDLPPSLRSGRDIRDIADRRRGEANFNSQKGRTSHFDGSSSV
ncbi:hypothetical protein MLD52_08850 [Puniceicoccaceae bacterium K14]|nr:hypothetical protein [Puniceicoccaceae bacterium K14]